MRLDGLLVINLYLFIYVNTPKNKKKPWKGITEGKYATNRWQ